MKYLNFLFLVFAPFYASAQSPFFIEKTPTESELFIVETEDGRMGVIDSNDHFIIPLDTVVLSQWFPPECSFFVSKRQTGLKFNQSLFDLNGKLLFTDVNVGYVGLGPHMARDDKSYRDFFVIEQKGVQSKLLFHKNRGQIMIDSIFNIEYGGYNSFFLVKQWQKTSTPKVISVFDLEGNKLFAVPPEVHVMHSGHPNLLIATKFNPYKNGLIDINKGIDSISFKYDALRKMRTGWFVYSIDKRKHFGLLDSNGRPCLKADFIKLGEPNRAEIAIFSKKFGSLPIATAVRAGMENSTWIGIDSLGNEHFFSDNTQPETIGQMEDRLEHENSKKVLRKLKDGNELENPPSFPGGESAMNEFLLSNLRYPKIAQENGVYGTVFVQLVVEEDGSLSHISVKKDIGNGCGLAAIQCMKKMPRWQPAVYKGKTIASRLIIPVQFSLNK